MPEYAKDGQNSFIIPTKEKWDSVEEQDEQDYQNMMKVLKETILPMYYEKPEEWARIMKNSMDDVVPFFESGRMADEYYTRLYNA